MSQARESDFRDLANYPECTTMFREKYGIPRSVSLTLLETNHYWVHVINSNHVAISLVAIVFGSVRFPFHPRIRDGNHDFER